MDWFLYTRDLRHEKIKSKLLLIIECYSTFKALRLALFSQQKFQTFCFLKPMGYSYIKIFQLETPSDILQSNNIATSCKKVLFHFHYKNVELLVVILRLV